MIVQVHYGFCLLRFRNSSHAINKATNSQEIFAKTGQVFYLCSIVFLSNPRTAPRCGRRPDMYVTFFFTEYYNHMLIANYIFIFFCRLLFPLHHHYPVGALECCAFRVQTKPNGKIFAIEFCLRYKKRDNSFGSLVAAWIRRDSSCDSSRNQHSSCNVSSSRVTRPVLHYNSEIHRPTQAPYRMNLPSKFRVHIVSHYCI